MPGLGQPRGPAPSARAGTDARSVGFRVHAAHLAFAGLLVSLVPAVAAAEPEVSTPLRGLVRAYGELSPRDVALRLTWLRAADRELLADHPVLAAEVLVRGCEADPRLRLRASRLRLECRSVRAMVATLRGIEGEEAWRLAAAAERSRLLGDAKCDEGEYELESCESMAALRRSLAGLEL